MNALSNNLTFCCCPYGWCLSINFKLDSQSRCHFYWRLTNVFTHFTLGRPCIVVDENFIQVILRHLWPKARQIWIIKYLFVIALLTLDDLKTTSWRRKRTQIQPLFVSGEVWILWLDFVWRSFTHLWGWSSVSILIFNFYKFHRNGALYCLPQLSLNSRRKYWRWSWTIILSN